MHSCTTCGGVASLHMHANQAAVCSGGETGSAACRRVDRNKYQIQIPLPPKIDPTVTMMTVEEKPDVTYSDIGGCKEQVGPCCSFA